MQPLIRIRGEEKALSLVEVLVVIVVGGLAVIALPSFGGQGSKGRDSEAKSMAVMAAQAMEACAAENGGYDKCSKDAVLAMDPSLTDAGDRLTVVTRSRSYEIGVMSRRDPSVSFTVTKAADGTTTRTCSTNEDRGGCQVPRTGTW